MGASETIYFNVKLPFPTFLVIASVITALGLFAVFLLMRKHKHQLRSVEKT